MGTNYYYFKASQGNDDPLHIGKSSAGWCFLLHVEPEIELNSFDDWEKLFNIPDSYIRNEYNELISAAAMIQTITQRSIASTIRDSEWLERNYAEAGPNNLMRSQVGRGCIGHGDGTWDYITGEFS